MKKEEMVEYLNSKNIDIPEKWPELQKLYFATVKEPEPKKILTKGDKLAITRQEIYPDIKKIVLEMRGQSRATGPQIKELFKLYNAFYLRHDDPSCSVCLTKVFVALNKLVKKIG